MDENVQKKLRDLFLLYQQNLPQKIANIEAQWKELQEKWDNKKIETLHREVHSLCGSAGTYGYAELAKTARQAEIYLKNHLLQAKELKKKDLKTLNQYFAQFKTSSLLKPTIASTQRESTQNKQNQTVYILENDGKLRKQLIQNLKIMEYHPYVLQDMITLKTSMKEVPPVAMVINCDFLDNDSIQFLHQREQNYHSTQLFCLVSGADLMSRLLAVRARCDAFFQLPLDISYFTQMFHNKCDTSSESFRILIVDDSETLAEYHALIINQAGMTAKAITNPLNLLEAIKSFQPDLLLMDIYMPECTGLELATVLRQEKNYTKIPIIFLSTEEDRSKQLFALSLGGDDFLSKPVSPDHLISAIRSRARRASMLNYYMITDSLTGLLNHSSTLKQLEIEIAQALQNKSALTVIMIDIDYFKKINDHYGHPVGDKVIKQIANLFLIYLRSSDIIGRYGGEEFILILPGTNVQNGEKICNDLLARISSYVFTEQDSKFSITFSAGISSLKDENEAIHIVNEADKALYTAKQQGRNQVVVYERYS